MKYLNSRNLIKIKYATAFAVAFLFMQVNAHAQINLDVNFDYNTQTISVSGRTEDVYAPLLLRVLPKNISADAVTEQVINDGQYPMITVFSDKEGAFEEEFIFPDKVSSGIYTVYADSEDDSAEKDFPYTKKSDTTAVCKLLNKANDASEVANILQNAVADEILFIEEFEENKESISKLIFSNRTEAGYNSENLIDEIKCAAAICILKNSDSENADAVVSAYGNFFGIDYEKDYKELSAAVKEDFLSGVKESSFTENTTDIFIENLVFAMVKNADTYVELRKIVEKYFSQIGADEREYNNLSENKKVNVFKELISKKIDSFDDIKKQLSILIENQNEADSSGDSGGGGRESGSGSSKGFTGEYSINANLESSESLTFYDISNHWSRAVVEALAEKGIVSGFEDNSFRPENKVTRAEFAKLIVKTFKLDEAEVQDFKDVSVTDWFAPFVGAAYKADIVNGNGMGEFLPLASITREDCCVMIYRALVFKGKSFNEKMEFSDFADVSAYAVEAISKLGGSKLINGYNSKFLPKNLTTRAEACTMLYNVVEYLEEVE